MSFIAKATVALVAALALAGCGGPAQSLSVEGERTVESLQRGDTTIRCTGRSMTVYDVRLENHAAEIFPLSGKSWRITMSSGGTEAPVAVEGPAEIAPDATVHLDLYSCAQGAEQLLLLNSTQVDSEVLLRARLP